MVSLFVVVLLCAWRILWRTETRRTIADMSCLSSWGCIVVSCWAVDHGAQRRSVLICLCVDACFLCFIQYIADCMLFGLCFFSLWSICLPWSFSICLLLWFLLTCLVVSLQRIRSLVQTSESDLLRWTVLFHIWHRLLNNFHNCVLFSVSVHFPLLCVLDDSIVVCRSSSFTTKVIMLVESLILAVNSLEIQKRILQTSGRLLIGIEVVYGWRILSWITWFSYFLLYLQKVTLTFLSRFDALRCALNETCSLRAFIFETLPFIYCLLCHQQISVVIVHYLPELIWLLLRSSQPLVIFISRVKWQWSSHWVPHAQISFVWVPILGRTVVLNHRWLHKFLYFHINL